MTATRRDRVKRQLADFVPPAELMDWLKGRQLDGVIHLGAISETTATDGDLVIETNFRLSMRLLDCVLGQRDAADLCVLGRDLMAMAIAGFCDDPSIDALENAPANESLRLE